MNRLFSIFLLLSLLIPVVSNSEDTLSVIDIKPQGEDVPSGRQVTFHFSGVIVPVGKMDRTSGEVPISFNPKLNCSWRWLSPSTLSCELTENDALVPATKYEISVTAGDGSKEAQQVSSLLNSFFKDNDSRRSFSTVRPMVSSAYFRTWLSPGKPIYSIETNQYVTRSSVESHIFFDSNGSKKAVTLVVDPELPDVPVPDSGGNWYVTPKKDLELDEVINLSVEPGLKSTTGSLTGTESRAIDEFKTFGDFRFIGVKCCVGGANVAEGYCEEADTEIIESGDTDGASRRCYPLAPISLLFSSPVLKDNLTPGLKITPPLRKTVEGEDPWEGMYSYVNVEYLEKENDSYSVSLPFGLKAHKKYKISGDASNIQDVFGRNLAEPFSLDFYTDHRLPRLVSDKTFSFLERDVQSHLPIVVQNLNTLVLQYTALTSSGLSSAITKEIPVDNVPDISYHFPLKVRDILPGGKGVIQGNINSRPDTKNFFFSTQVTPFHVHVKLGHFGTLVWVSDLSSGAPIEGATVSVIKELLRSLTNPPALTSGKTDKNGLAMLPGSDELDPFISTSYYDLDKNSLKVKVEKDSDIALVPLTSQVMVDAEGSGGRWIETDRVPVYGHIRTWGTTPQGVYRLGDEIHFKIYVRNEGTSALSLPPKGGYSLTVYDPTNRSVYEKKDITLSDFGAIEGNFVTPQSGKVGWYRFELKGSFPGDSEVSQSERFTSTWGKKWFEDRYRTWEPLRVLVSDFTPAPFRVQTDIVGKRFDENEAVSLNVRAMLHAGGPYGSAPSRVVARLTPGTFPSLPPSLESYSFSESYYSGDYESEVFRSDFTLTSQGELSTSFTIPESSIRLGNLVVEGAVSDERGKFVASTATVPFASRDRFAGVNFSKWTYEKGKQAAVDIVVVDGEGIPTAGAPIEVKIIYKETLASQIKGPGNAFIPHYETVEHEVKSCALTSEKAPVSCAFTPEKPGEYTVKATVTDTKGRTHLAATDTYVVGHGELLWASGSPTRLDVVPEKTTYKVGEKARFLVKNPFPGCRALITVERYGIVSKWFETMKDAAHVISFDVEKNHLPGFYLSVAAFSPRVTLPLEGDVDLGKPSMKLGYATIEVKDGSKELKITATPDKAKYAPRDKVKVKLHAETKEGSAPPTEFAVAVLDESVFDLIAAGNNYFDPYKGLYKLDPLDVSNFNLLLQLVGRRKFQKKGANSGGDGGMDISSRSNIKYVSYWNPSLMANASGDATVEFETPDNLTGWRILAIGMTKSDRMGLGVGNFKVNRDTEVRAALPNDVREGDSFDARFSFMNRTDKVRTLSVKIEASGEGFDKVTKEESIVAEPFERKFVSVPLVAAKKGEITLVASASDSTDRDSLTVKLPVVRTKHLETVNVYGSLAEEKVELPVELPKLLDPSEGGVRLSLSPTILSSAEAHIVALRDYPFSCWEQRLSRTIGAAYSIALSKVLPPSASWPDAKQVIEKGLGSARDFQAPNGGMSYYLPLDERVDPYLSAYTALGFEWLKHLGYSIPKDVESNLHRYIENLLRHPSVPSYYTEDMIATVRSISLNALSRSGKVSIEDLKRLDSLLPRLSIFGRSQLLEAATYLKGSAEYIAELSRLLTNQSNETSGKLTFQEPVSYQDFERILTSELRSTCGVLSALVSDPGKKEMSEKIARTILRESGRQVNTQENAFCLSALSKYGEIFEKEEPKGTWSGKLFEEKLGEASFKSRQDPVRSIEKKFSASDPGRKGIFELIKSGQGRAYFIFGLSYFDPSEKKNGKNVGVELRRSFQVLNGKDWVPVENSFEIKRGDTIRVNLVVSLPGARHFLVVDDPVPGGLEPVNRDLATASESDTEGDTSESSYAFYHRELRHESARFYSEFLQPGNYDLSYTAQAIATGSFSLPEAIALEMYEPEVYGTSESGLITIKDQ